MSCVPACAPCRNATPPSKHWLDTKVGPVFDAMQANPSRAIPAEQVRERLRAHHATRLKARRGA